MDSLEVGAPTVRTRREPPPFRRVVVRRTQPLSPRLLRVTVSGPDLEGLVVDEPAASIRLLLPSPASAELVLPIWQGNEFLLPDGRRPTLRTLTPRRVDADALELDLEIVLHGPGEASQWAQAARPGDSAAVSGPGRGYAVDRDAAAFLLAGDETALPAISQLLEALPTETPAEVHVEVATIDGRMELPGHRGTTVHWHDRPVGDAPGAALVAAVRSSDLVAGVRVWAAGEAAAMQRLRRHLFEDRGLDRSKATVRGYWKVGRTAGGPDGT
jgi:NADPH-dependent ferric siderophore reductase